MRKILLSLAFLIFVFSNIYAGEIDLNLQEKLEDYGENELVPVMIFLKQQADIENLDYELKSINASFPYRHEVVVGELQEVAFSTQENLQNFFDEKAENGNVEKLRNYWIVNAFAVHVQKGIIPEIANHPDVEKIYFDEMLDVIRPVEVGEPTRAMEGRAIEQNLIAIRADECWEIGITGKHTLVGVIDTGVDMHEAYEERWRGNFAPPEHCYYDGINPSNHTPHDNDGHGTHVTGIVTGFREFPERHIGVAYEAQWIGAGCWSGNGLTSSALLASIQFMTDPDGDPATTDDVPDAVNNSWGGQAGSDPCQIYYYNAIDNCEAAGVILVFSQGNDGPTGAMTSPADRATTYYNTFAVGATQKSEPYTITNFSTRGPSTCATGDLAIKPEVSAPGLYILSSKPNNMYGGESGTSMSAPHVTGVFALLRQVNPNINVEDAKQILMDTAIDKGTAGEDNTYGWGFIDAYEAVMATYATQGHFKGYVTDSETGLPVEGAKVYLMENQRFETVTDSNGYYHLSSPQPGTFRIKADKFFYYTYQSPAGYNVNSPDTITVDINLNPRPATYLNGEVNDATTGEPIIGALLKLVDVPIDSVWSDTTGFYEFTPIPGDYSYELEISAENYEPQNHVVNVPADGFTMNFVLYATESFEDDAGGFYTGEESEWEWGVPQSSGGPGNAHMGQNAWGTDLDEPYSTLQDYYLYSPTYNILEDQNLYQMQFYHWYEMENNFDGGNVQVSIVGEDEWRQLTPEGDYPSYNILAFAFTGVDTMGGYTGISGEGTTPQWVAAQFDISEFEGMSIQFRFKFASAFTSKRGWFIDDLLVYGGEKVESSVHDQEEISVPKKYALYQNYPNPFNPITTISFSMPVKENVELKIYDMAGKLVKTLVDGEIEAGYHKVKWNGTDEQGKAVNSGVYLYRIDSQKFSDIKRMILLK